MRDQQGRAADGSESLSLGNDIGIGKIALGTAEREVHTESRRAQHERLGDVVAIADEGELEALNSAEVVADGLHIGEGLAGMIEVAQGVDDGDARPGGEPFDGSLEEDAGDDAVDPAIEIAGDVFEGFADADGAFDEDAAAAELLDGELESELGAEAGFFE